jgi:hypothetical protein
MRAGRTGAAVPVPKLLHTRSDPDTSHWLGRIELLWPLDVQKHADAPRMLQDGFDPQSNA